MPFFTFLTRHQTRLPVLRSRCTLTLCPLSLPQASPTPGNELPGGQYLRLQQPDVCGRTFGPADPAGVQAAGDSQSQQAAVCAVEPQQSVSRGHT